MSDAPVRYTVRMADPHAHLFEVCIDIPAPAPEGACLRLPAWIPGSYMVRDFARHVISLQATSLPADLPAPAPETGDGHADEDSWSRHGTPVAVRKTDKSTWQCAPCAGPLRVRLEVYAFDLSVRGAWLDQSRGYFNGVCLFPAVRGCESAAAQVGLVRPEGQAGLGWQVATSMRAQDVDSGGFGTYTADDYQDLIDHPVEMSDVDVEPFEVAGVAHRLVLTGRQRYDVDRLTQDLQAVCREHHGMLPAPDDLDRYVFLVHVADRMGGGLEHRWSNSCIVARDMLPRAGMAADDRRYARLLALLSHEYFHLWHVKRTQPAAFQPFDLGAEQYTQTLWVFEGITSYYDTLALVRAGVISEATYLELLAERIGAVVRTPGRQRQSIAESSFDAWIKLYKRDENANNALISYYSKGSLVALALDLLIRRETAGERSLDDVMRVLWARHGATGQGIGEAEFEALAEDVSGVPLASFFAATVHGTADPDLVAALAGVGVALTWEVPALETGGNDWYVPALGAGCRREGEAVALAYVDAGGAAHAAGLSAGDRFIALDGIRLDADNFLRRMGDARPGDSGSVHAFRRDVLMQFDLTFAQPQATAARLELESAEGAAEAATLRDAWLGSVADRAH